MVRLDGQCFRPCRRRNGGEVPRRVGVVDIDVQRHVGVPTWGDRKAPRQGDAVRRAGDVRHGRVVGGAQLGAVRTGAPARRRPRFGGQRGAGAAVLDVVDRSHVGGRPHGEVDGDRGPAGVDDDDVLAHPRGQRSARPLDTNGRVGDRVAGADDDGDEFAAAAVDEAHPDRRRFAAIEHVVRLVVEALADSERTDRHVLLAPTLVTRATTDHPDRRS